MNYGAIRIWFLGQNGVSNEKTTGVVIRLADFSETSRVVTFFTRAFGKTAVIAKGAKRLRGPFDAALDLLAELDIVFIAKSSGALGILTEAKIRQRFRAHERSLDALHAGYYLAELLDRLTEESDPHPGLYPAAVTAIDHLHRSTPVWLTVARFELVLLRELGHLPQLDACVLCGAAVVADAAGEAAEACSFSVGRGGVVCLRCVDQAQTMRRLQPGTLRLMQALSEAGDAWTRLAISETQLRELRSVLNGVLTHLHGGPFRTARFLSFHAGRS